MTLEFRFFVDDKPGSLNKLATCLSDSGINIDGISGLSANGQGLIHFVTDRPDEAKKAFTKAGLKFTTKEVLKLNLSDHPGELAKLTKALADAGINLKEFYITMDRHQIIDADDIEAARKIASDIGFI